MDLAAAKAVLQRQEGGGSVYDHLTEVILRVITQQPANALQSFEAISATVKAGATAAVGGAGAASAGSSSAGAEEHAKAVLARLEAHSKLFAPAVNEDGAAGEPVQDLVEEANYLEWAGVCLGRTETFRLHLAMKHLAAKTPSLKGLRLWGKILGRSSDYVILEGTVDPEDGEEEGAKDALGNTLERSGEGANKHTYWVCSAVGEEWTRLPNVTPHQIIVARAIRRLFTGDLKAPVAGHPPFPGTEANYLRAQIALIAAGTVLAPAGSHTATEEGDVAEQTEEWDGPDMSTPDGWIHTRLDLNTKGRTKPNPPTTNADGEEVPEPDAPEPSVPAKPIGDDPPVDEAAEEGGGSWDVRPVPTSGVADGEATGVSVVRSLRWPGAFAVGFAKKRWANIYVGYGHEVALKPYQPALPPALPVEFDYLTAEAQVVKEQADVAVDPDAGKPAEEGDDAAEE